MSSTPNVDDESQAEKVVLPTSNTGEFVEDALESPPTIASDIGDMSEELDLLDLADKCIDLAWLLEGPVDTMQVTLLHALTVILTFSP